jgi:hypothetical protein
LDKVCTKSETEITPPTSFPELLAYKEGYIKICLSYLTSKPKHLRSLLLYHTYNIKPPYTEEVSILIPCAKTFTLLETFIPAFERLQKAGVVPNTAELQGFSITDEDELTLAYTI